MAASPVFGSPQWLNLRSITPSTSAVPYYDQSTEGLTNITPYSASVAASHLISAGPMTSGMVYISVNGACYAVPFNTAVSIPDFVVKALDSSQWTYL